MRNTKKPADCKISGFFLLLFFTLSNNSFAQHPSPFSTRNESPFSLIYGLPLASPAKLLENNQSRWISSFNISNTINSQTSNSENLFIDIETWHVNFLYDTNLKENWMLRVQLPYIVHSGGFLDSPIDSYHQALGLPENIRPDFPHEQINIDYNLNNQNQVNINSRQNALGDISFQLAWQAHLTNRSALSYWLSIKLPTGNEDKLTGSGATDVASWASMSYRLTDTRWLYGQGGLLYMGDSDVFTDIHKNWAGFANAGIKFQLWNEIELKAQLDVHSALYDSKLDFLNQVIQLTFGGSYTINSKQKLDFAIAEDIKEGSSPDVNFNISWWIYL
ncbi:MAG: hypothetical protein DIZ80_12205 [endosymbiont of Galathealinum brachiosum]|uniref:DUF3187 domain-containing protein n=1 Tax=endosymbiont of Galathealinum brachiosum TaxID=2200906 RepID=A0A370DDN1_9GAMM|nr:MAG: hypothetical protein DIZ80_12205 [endosymbiont of Galathealinum brachiosum]